MQTRTFTVRIEIPVVDSHAADEINAALRDDAMPTGMVMALVDRVFPGALDKMAEVATEKGIIVKNRLDFVIKACREEMKVSLGCGFLITEFGVWTGTGFVDRESIVTV